MIQRRVAAAAVLAVAAVAAAGCGFQSPNETSVEHASIQGADFALAGVDVRDAFVTAPDASAAPASDSAKSYLFATLVNDRSAPDSLVGVTIGSGGSVTINGGTTGQVTLPPGVLVSIASPTLRPDGPSATVDLAQPPQPGTTIPMQFSFAQAGTSRTEAVPVVTNDVSFAPTQYAPIVPATMSPEAGERASD